MLNELYIINKLKNIIGEKETKDFSINDFIKLIELCIEDSK